MAYKTMCYAIFSEIVVFLSREYTSSQNQASHPELIHIGRAIAYMENHFTEDLKLEDLASIASLSIRHFSRVFKQLYNDSPLNYILCLRIKYACHLLRETDLTVIEIASASEFNDGNYFTRYFKKIMQCTPLSYKNFYHKK